MSTQAAKLFSAILAGSCGLLLLLAIAMQAGFGRGYSWLAPDVEPLGGGDAAVDRSQFKLPPETQFADTSARPLFNDDRKPTPEGSDDADAPPPPPAVPLNIALTGIILTPDVQIAMVHDKIKNNDVALKVGMPMPGDQGGWTLTELKPRSAIFRESAGDEVEVELSTAVASPTPNTGRGGRPGALGARPPLQAPVAAPGAEAPANPQAQALQQRIEERRAQMREEAERLRQKKTEHQQ